MFLRPFAPFRAFIFSPANMRSCLLTLLRSCPLVLLLPLFISAQAVFINEFHYDNTGVDVNEGVEIAGPAGTDLACYQVYLYNQTDSMFYDTVNLYGVIDDEGCGYGAVWFPVTAIQNGPSDAVALVNECNCGGICDSTDVVNFLSYEGVIQAKDGPAGGLQSDDMGVSEPSTLAIGNSLQLTGSGVNYPDFSWSAPSASSVGAINTGQSFGGGIVTDRLSFISFPATCSGINDTFSLTVCGTDSAGDVSNVYSGTVTLSQVSGPGNLTGTLTLAAASCCARFTDLNVDSAGIYSVVASDGINFNDTLFLSFSDTCGKCFEINSILVEACEPIPGTEGANEMVRFTVGPDDLDANDLYVVWPNNAWLGVCQDSVTAAIIDSINNMITYGGSVSEPVNGIIPAGATVIMATSTNFDWDSHDWTYLNYDIYMIFQCAGNLQGHFKNNEGCPCGTRTLIMTFAGACSDTVVYTVDSLPNGGNGGDGDAVVYDAAGNPQYGNNQCLPPIFPFSLNLFMAAQPVSCKGGCDGIGSVFHTGGVKPYTYLWNDPAVQNDSLATGLCAGTYSITVTDWLGTTAVDSVLITEPDLLTAVISSVTDVSCYGDSSGSVSVAAAGGSMPYSYLWNTGVETQGLASLQAGNYLVTVTDSNGCTATASAIITEPPQLIVTIDSIKNVACYGDSNGYASILVSGGTPGYSFVWNTGDTGFTISGIPDGNYSVTITDSNNCSISSDLLITEPQMLSFTANPVNSTCGNQNGSACLIVVGGTPPVSVTWNTVPPVSGSCISSVFAGIYNPVVTDTNGCIFTTPVIISDIPGPVIDSLSGEDVTCFAAGNGSVSAYVSGGTPPFSYIWQTGGSTISTGSLTALNLTDGTYAFIIIDGNNCTETDTFTLTSPSPISLSVFTSDASCGNSDGMAWVTVSGSVPPYSYQWNDTASQTNDTAFNLTAGGYKVIVVDSSNCTDSASITVNNAGAPVISIDSVNNASCFGSSNGAIYISVNGGTPPFTYGWSNSSNNEDLLNVLAGSYTVTVTDSLGCLDFETTSISEPAQIITNTSAAICEGDSIFLGGGWQKAQDNYFDTLVSGNGCDSIVVTALVVNATPVADFYWIPACEWDTTLFFDSSLISPGTITYWEWNFFDGWKSYLQNPSHVFVSCDSCWAQLIVRSDSNCLDTVEKYITIYENPFADFSAAGVCQGEQSQFIDQSVSDNTIISWIWNFGDMVTDSLQNTSHIYANAGLYTVTLIINTNKNCIDTVSKFVESYAVPIAFFSLSDACEGQSVFFNEQSFSTDTLVQFSWDFGDGIGTSNQSDPSYLYPVHGTYFSILAVSTDEGCTDTAANWVYVFSRPVIQIGSDTTGGCSPMVIQFSDQSTDATGSIVSWIWDFGDGSYSVEKNPSHNYFFPGSYSISLQVTTSNQCMAAELFPDYLTVWSKPVAEFSASPNVTTTQSPEISFSNQSTPGSFWMWVFGDGDSAFIENPVHFYSDTGFFNVTLLVTSADGCTDTINHLIRINPDYTFNIPTSFSPNDDGVNETWILRGIENYPGALVEIFNRWGSKIFSSTGYSTPWDGTYNGNKVPPATYYFIVTPGMDKETVTGAVTIVW